MTLQHMLKLLLYRRQQVTNDLVNSMMNDDAHLNKQRHGLIKSIEHYMNELRKRYGSK